MEGQVCLFNCNRQWERSNQLPVSPGHVRPETSRTWRTCWNSQNQYYSRNVGRWLFTQCGGVRHGSVCLHALVLINSHSGWIAPSIDTRRSPQVIKQAPLPQILPLATCFFFYLSLCHVSVFNLNLILQNHFTKIKASNHKSSNQLLLQVSVVPCQGILAYSLSFICSIHINSIEICFWHETVENESIFAQIAGDLFLAPALKYI